MFQSKTKTGHVNMLSLGSFTATKTQKQVLMHLRGASDSRGNREESKFLNQEVTGSNGRGHENTFLIL